MIGFSIVGAVSLVFFGMIHLYWANKSNCKDIRIAAMQESMRCFCAACIILAIISTAHASLPPMPGSDELTTSTKYIVAVHVVGTHPDGTTESMDELFPEVSHAKTGFKTTSTLGARGKR